MDYAQESLKLHYQWKGKLDIVPKMAVASKMDLFRKTSSWAGTRRRQ